MQGLAGCEFVQSLRDDVGARMAFLEFDVLDELEVHCWDFLIFVIMVSRIMPEIMNQVVAI